jgi:hypothetical protein
MILIILEETNILKNKIGADGKIEIVTAENMKFDTLSNGRIVARRFQVQIAQVPVDEKRRI